MLLEQLHIKRIIMWESCVVHSVMRIKLLTQYILHVMCHTVHNNLLCITSDAKKIYTMWNSKA